MTRTTVTCDHCKADITKTPHGYRVHIRYQSCQEDHKIGREYIRPPLRAAPDKDYHFCNSDCLVAFIHGTPHGT